VITNIKQAKTMQDCILQTFDNFLQKYIERQPKTTRVYQIDDLLLYRANGILTPAEAKLVADQEDSNTLRDFMIKQWDELKPIIRMWIQETVNHPVLGITVDLSIEHDELIIICRF
jgi:uncharacterized protein YbcI